MVSSGGDLRLSSGGIARTTTLAGYGSEYILAGAVGSGDSVQSAGKEFISSGGVTRLTTVQSGGAEYVYSSGVASGTTLSGAEAYISTGGRTVGATVSSGGILDVLSGATATGTVVSFDGDDIVQSGAVASGTQVQFGGLEHVYSSGLSVATTISSGGREIISAGGTASNLTLLSGGDLVDSGSVTYAGAGTLAGNLSGAGQLVESGGGDLLISGKGSVFDGQVLISGGTVEMATSGALGDGYIQFVPPATGSAVLQIDAAAAPPAGTLFANVISNFNGAHEDIDLTGIPFLAGASATYNAGELTLIDGANAYYFELEGTTAGAYPVLSDGHGGTLIDPTAAAPKKAIDPKVVAFAHTLAAFAPSDAANAAVVSGASPSGLPLLARAIGSGGGGHF